jgi:hypothetical protein
MKRKILFSAQIALLLLFGFSFLAFIFQLTGKSNPLSKLEDSTKSVYNGIEAYDPSLSRLNSLEKLEQYCDSIYGEKAFAGGSIEFERTYTDIVSSAVRNRFFHGYSYYSINDNYLAKIVAKVTMPGLNALVIPDEILKHPYAACSQQSIVMMEVLKDKGLSTRKISFEGKKFGGHFAFEVFYDGTWHFNDPNLEPDKSVLDNHGRPGIDFLVRNPDILTKAYAHRSSEEILDIFPTYSYGPVNKFPAPKALIFQKATHFLTYTIWIVFLIAFMIVRRSYLRIKRKMPAHGMKVLHRMESVPASVYYPDYKTQGS